MKNDWEFYDWAYQIEKQLKQEVWINTPKNESEWLEIFPEARKVVGSKIKEWKQISENARLTNNRALEIIKLRVNEKNRWFWENVVKYTFSTIQEMIEADKHIRRLQWTLPTKKQATGIKKWKDQLERARTKDIALIAQSYGLSMKKTGRTYKLLCPKHNEKTPSFHIYPPTHYVCFGCGIKGDVISFVQLIDNCTFKEAIIKLQNI
jgi:hypothetical protein